MKTLNECIILILLLFAVSSCNDTNVIDKVEENANRKHHRMLQTEFNPVYLSKDCNSSTVIKVFVPKPYPNHIGFSKYRRNDAHRLVYYLDTMEVLSIPIDDDFSVFQDSTKFRIGHKVVEIELPSFSKELKESGKLTLKLFSHDELITSYSTNYYYVSDNLQQEGIRRLAVKWMKDAGPLKLNDYHNNNIVTEVGYYTDDIKYFHRIEKMADHYLSIYSAKGNKVIMSKDNKTNWQEVMQIPDFPILISQIPLAFELAEISRSNKSIGSSILDSSYLGNNIVFDYMNQVIGSSVTLQFNECELDILESKDVYMPLHLRFNARKLVE